jgi:hypothetical protein
MDITELKKWLANPGSNEPWGADDVAKCKAALAEIERLEGLNSQCDIDVKLQLVPEDQVWQDRRRFDQFFAAAITGLASCQNRGLASSIAWNAATIALEAMSHRFRG